MGRQFSILADENDQVMLSSVLTEKANARFLMFSDVGDGTLQYIDTLGVVPPKFVYWKNFLSRTDLIERNDVVGRTFRDCNTTVLPLIEYSVPRISDADTWRLGRMYVSSEADLRFAGAAFDVGEFYRWQQKLFRVAKSALVRADGIYWGRSCLDRFKSLEQRPRVQF